MTFVTSEPYIGHLGLDGVGDTKGLLESEMREKHIKWITNARVKSVGPGTMAVEELAEDGTVRKNHELPFKYSMMLPAFRGVGAVHGIDKLTNPRGFILVDKNQRNPDLPQRVRDRGLRRDPAGRADARSGRRAEDRLHDRIHGDGDGAEHRRAAARASRRSLQPTWNAICLADFGDNGVAFLAQPQIPPRNVNWSSKGEWVHYAKVAFEKYFLRKIRRGESEPFYERFLLDKLNIAKIKEVKTSS